MRVYLCMAMRMSTKAVRYRQKKGIGRRYRQRNSQSIHMETFICLFYWSINMLANYAFTTEHIQTVPQMQGGYIV